MQHLFIKSPSKGLHLVRLLLDCPLLKEYQPFSLSTGTVKGTVYCNRPVGGLKHSTERVVLLLAGRVQLQAPVVSPVLLLSLLLPS